MFSIVVHFSSQLLQSQNESARFKDQVRRLEQQYNALYQQYEVLNQRYSLRSTTTAKVYMILNIFI